MGDEIDGKSDQSDDGDSEGSGDGHLAVFLSAGLVGDGQDALALGDESFESFGNVHVNNPSVFSFF